jgi:PAS domain S-box-containing protein
MKAHAEDRVNHNTRFLEQIAENIREIIWMYDTGTGTVSYVNPAYERIVGRSVESLYEHPESWRAALHPDDRDLVKDHGHPLRDSGSLEFRIVRPDGEIRWLWSHAVPMHDDGGLVIGIVGVVEDITERKRAEQSLERSLSLLRASFESTADGILVVDKDGKVTGCNRRFLDLWKIPDFIAAHGADDELLAYVGDQLVEPDSFRRKVVELYADPQAESFDVLEFRDGRVFERYSLPQLLGEEVVGRVWSFRDVTARVRAENALRQRHRRLDIHNRVLLRLAQRRIRHTSDLRVALPEIAEAAAEMLDTERVSVWLFDEEHTKIRTLELYERSKRVHSAGAELFRADFPAYFEAMELERSIDASAAARDPRTREFKEPYLEPLGISSMLDAPIRAGGRLLGVVCFEHVGTQRNWTAEDRTFAASIADLISLTIESAELQRAEDGVHLLLDASRILAQSLDYHATLASVARFSVPTLADWCVVFVMDKGKLQRVAVAHADPEKEEMLEEFERYYPGSAGTSLAARVTRLGEPELVPVLTEELLRERTVDEKQRQLIRQIGLRSYMAMPLIARDVTVGAITFASATRSYDAQDFVLARDIASRAATAIDNARLHQQVKSASIAKSNFLAVMSHELRTPLSAITGYADLLEDGIPEPLTPRQKEQVGRIKLRAYDLLRSIEEILAFSRMETGDERFHFENIEIGQFLREIFHEARPTVVEHNIDFRVNYPDQHIVVRTDPAKLRHILLDLISNAVKFTKQGSIEISADMEDSTARIRVSDTGIGIPAEYRDKIFEPFFQVEDPMTREKGGTGIGLAVVRKMARHLGGEVTVESRPQEGSTFIVTVPSHE